MPPESQQRVITVAPLPAEKCAYALARYSRSPDSIRDSLEWVRSHDSQKFLEHFYFQYGHASIADLGHVVMCFEGVSELVAAEIEDEPLWDGQARSSRYQNFGQTGFITPPEVNQTDAAVYSAAASGLLSAYQSIHSAMVQFLREKLPRPDAMSPPAYERNIAARAFDVARYLLFWGVPTGVGQVTSIRTLEKQIRRLKASDYQEARELADEMTAACSRPPSCGFDSQPPDPVAPTLARHVDADPFTATARANLRRWAEQNLPPRSMPDPAGVDLLRPTNTPADIAATLLYTVTDRPFRELYELMCGWGERRRAEVIEVALERRARRDELPRAFRGGLYAFDIIMDIGAYRDLHRHRRCQQFRQPDSDALGFETPGALVEAGLAARYETAIRSALDAFRKLPAPARDYVLPFGTRCRRLFKMDFAEAEYMSRLRSGVKGHFSYRRIAWEMKRQMEQLEPELGRWIDATPPWIEDPLKR
ncbi:MAG TPA: FAD-dependent thymidylate synthase [Bryobacteraceae bacterium]|nr:FAD-dependent thymidylate synthase [Bryobacteraceae bacterium]